MKVKGLDKFQHFHLDRIWQKVEDGLDLPKILEGYTLIDNEIDAQDWAEDAHAQLSAYPAIDPDNGQWRTWGFVPPLGNQPELELRNHKRERETTQCLALAVPGTTGVLLSVEKRERILPSASLADKVFERVKQFEEREGQPATKKDWAILKDEVTAAELKTAPVRRTRILVLLWDKDCYVFTSSAKAAEETTGIIRGAFTSFPTVHAYVNDYALSQFFKKVVVRDAGVCEDFTPGDAAVFMNDEGEKITIKDADLSEERYMELLQSDKFLPTELLFALRVAGAETVDKTWVKMNKKGDVKAFSSVEEDVDGEELSMESQRERGAAGFDSRMADIWLTMRSLRFFTEKMESIGLCSERNDSEYVDGDELDDAHQARLREAEKADEGDVTAQPAGEDEDDEWAVADDEEEDEI